YKSDSVYWLSRIISTESGNQPLAGKVAVGTVILNRVSSPLFPNTIYEVIFDHRGGSYQFSPARSGSISREPNEQSVLAAKLCLDGAQEAGPSLYFNRAGITCWASRNRTLITTIGAHSFDHPEFWTLSKEEQMQQMVKSTNWVNEKIQPGIRAFAFPFTDSGIAPEVLQTIHEQKICDITFGTAGLKYDSFPLHFQRYPVEMPGNFVQNIKSEWIYYLLRKWVGKETVKH
ncbi:MAG: hypothetical protein EOM73_05065, partial [Bacteroidia bacterium]|nr:hypothetical protein [Bacteroidia bacterium]